MMRRYRRRGWYARLQRTTHQLLGREPGAVRQQAARLLPDRIQFFENYRYKLAGGSALVYEPTPTVHKGEVQIDLPFSPLRGEPPADLRRATNGSPGAVEARYGWLALTRVVKTDIHQRFPRVRPWPDPSRTAFPLVVPALDEETALLEQRIEAGWHERESLYYTPAPPIPFPFQLSLALSRDAAVAPVWSQLGVAEPLVEPTSATAKAMLLHVELRFDLRRPPGVREEECAVELMFFTLKWPTPPVVSHFELQPPSKGHLRVDSRFNQVNVGGLRATFTSTGSGPLRAVLSFGLVLKQPAVLESVEELGGILGVALPGVTLSGVRAQFFDAAGFPRNHNAAGEPLLQYRSDLMSDFALRLSEALAEPALVLERHYGWVAGISSPNPLRELPVLLREQRFELEERDAPDHAQRWRATRLTAGRPLIVDVELGKQELPSFRLGAFPVETGEAQGVGPARAYYELTLRASYRGGREDMLQQLDDLEELLHHRLHLRH